MRRLGLGLGLQGGGGGGASLKKFTLISGGQSLEDYKYKRGTPRVSQDYATVLAAAFGFTPGTINQYTSGVPTIVSDESSKGAGDHTIRLINAAVGGSALIDVNRTHEIDPATSSSGASNYWWNTQNNSAVSDGGALDATPNTPGPLWRKMMSYITTYGVDAVEWSQGASDAGIGSDPTRVALYKSVLKLLIQAARDASGKPGMPWHFMHHGRDNTASDSGYQSIADLQYQITQEMANVYLTAQEYYGRLAYGRAIANCTMDGTTNVILTASDTSAAGVGDGWAGPGIPDNTYITAINSGVSVTLNKNTTAAASGVTLFLVDGGHMYPGSDGIQPLDTNGNTTHDQLSGFYNMCHRAVRGIVLAARNATNKRSFGPYLSAAAAQVNTNKIYLTVTQDTGMTLTTVNGAISAASAPCFRVENNGVAMTVTGVSYSTGVIMLTTSANVADGTISVWHIYGAMNKSDFKTFILDDSSPYALPLQRTSPTINGAMSITAALGIPANTAAPGLSGGTAPGSLLSGTNGTWNESPTGYLYKWQDDTGGSYADIAGQTGSTYTSISAQSGHNVRFGVAATNAAATSAYVFSSPIAVSARNTSDLSSTLASTAFDLDATLSASTDLSSQTWANMVAAPADGAAQTDYNFSLGSSTSVSTDDPTPNGSANDTGAFWSFDGADIFRLIATTNPALLKNLHKTTGGTPFWIAFAVKTPATISATSILMSTRANSSGHGFQLGFNSSNQPFFTQQAGNGAGFTSTFAALSITANTDYLVIISGDMSAPSNNVKCWLNARTGTVNSATPGTDTTDAPRAVIGAAESISSLLPNGWIVRTAAGGNELLDNTKAGKIFDLLNSRHNRTYA